MGNRSSRRPPLAATPSPARRPLDQIRAPTDPRPPPSATVQAFSEKLQRVKALQKKREESPAGILEAKLSLSMMEIHAAFQSQNAALAFQHATDLIKTAEGQLVLAETNAAGLCDEELESRKLKLKLVLAGLKASTRELFEDYPEYYTHALWTSAAESK